MTNVTRIIALVVILIIAFLAFGSIVVLVQRPTTITTVKTTTSTITLMQIRTANISPSSHLIPDNVTFLLVQASCGDSLYQISIDNQLMLQGNVPTNTSKTIPISGLYSGDHVDIQWNTGIDLLCSSSSSGYLYDNNTLVGAGYSSNGGEGIISWVA